MFQLNPFQGEDFSYVLPEYNHDEHPEYHFLLEHGHHRCEISVYEFLLYSGFLSRKLSEGRKIYFCVSNWCWLWYPLSIKMKHEFENSSVNFSYHVFKVTKSIIGCDNLKGISQLLLLKFHFAFQDWPISSSQLFQDNHFFSLFWFWYAKFGKRSPTAMKFRVKCD